MVRIVLATEGIRHLNLIEVAQVDAAVAIAQHSELRGEIEVLECLFRAQVRMSSRASRWRGFVPAGVIKSG